MVSAGSLSLGSPEAGLGMKSLTPLMARSQETPAGSPEETRQGCDKVQFQYNPRGRSGVRAQRAPSEVGPAQGRAGDKWRPVP